MCTVLLPAGGNSIAVNKYIISCIISHISYHISYHWSGPVEGKPDDTLQLDLTSWMRYSTDACLAHSA